jgi:hypothetical protein
VLDKLNIDNDCLQLATKRRRKIANYITPTGVGAPWLMSDALKLPLARVH